MFDKNKHNVLNIKLDYMRKKLALPRLNYVGTWEVNKILAAVFHNPDSLEGPEYLLVTSNAEEPVVHKLYQAEISAFRKIVAFRCNSCSEIIYSPSPDFKISCSCKLSWVSNGIKMPFSSPNCYMVVLDMLAKFNKNEEESDET